MHTEGSNLSVPAMCNCLRSRMSWIGTSRALACSRQQLPIRRMTMQNTNTLASIELSDLTLVTGGRMLIPGGGGAPPQVTTPQPQPQLSCPTGTVPNYTSISGQLQVHLPGGVGVTGAGSYTNFHCDPMPKAKK